MAIRVYDKASQTTRDVPSAEAQRGVQQGDYDVVDPTVRVASGNRTGKVSSADLLTAIGQGARLVDEDEVDAITLHREESDTGSQVVGAIEAGAEGASLGLSTKLEEALGADPEAMRIRREGLGGLGTAIEIAGAAVPAVMSGGGSLAAGGAGRGLASTIARSTPAGLASRAGMAVERGVARTLGAEGAGMAASAARRVLPTAAGQFVEGMAYGAGTELHESVLGQRDMQAEHILAGGLMGAALGGVTGAAIPGIARVATGAAKLPRAAARKVLGLIGDLPQNIDGMANAWARTAAKVSAGDEAKFLRAAGYATTPQKRAFAHRAINNYDQVLAETSEQIAGATTRAKSTLDEAIDLVSGENHLRALESKVPKNADLVAPRMVANDLTEIDRRLAVIEEKNLKRGGYVANDVEAARARVQTAIAEAAERPGAAGAYRAANRFKQDLDLIVRKRSKGPMDSATRDTVDELREAAGRMRKNLEREDLWGEAGLMQQERNAAISHSLRRRDELGGKGTVLGRMLDRSKPVSSADALALAKSHGKAAGGAKTERLDAALDADLDVLRMAQKHYDLPPETVKKIADAEQAVKDMRKQLATQAENSELLEVVGHLRSAEGGGSPSIGLASTVGPSVAKGIGSAVGAGAGALFGGPAGALIGHGIGSGLGTLLGAATRPYTTFRTMIALGHAADKAGIQIDAKVGQFLGKMRGGSKPRTSLPARRSEGGRRPLTRAANATASKVAADRKESLANLRRRVIQISANPGLLADELEPALFDTRDVAPGIAEQITAKADVTARFLATKIPPSYQSPFSSAPPVIDSVALSQFERYEEGATRPLDTLDRLNDGSFTVEHAEALRACWPSIYKDVQDSVYDELALARAEERDIPFRERMTIGTLFDMVTDDSLQPETMAMLQHVWTIPAPQDAMQPRVLASPTPELNNLYSTPATNMAAGRSTHRA